MPVGPSAGGGLSTGEYDIITARSPGSAGFPHSSHSGIVRGSDGSDMVTTTSTKGISATIPVKRSGRWEYSAPCKRATRRQPAAHDASAVDKPVGEKVGDGRLVVESVGLRPQMAVQPPSSTQLASAAGLAERTHDAAVE